MEAGAIIATFTDKSSSLHLAKNFLLHKTPGENVFTTVSKTIKHAKCIKIRLEGVSSTIVNTVDCHSTCAECEQNEFICESCASEGCDMPFTQL